MVQTDPKKIVNDHQQRQQDIELLRHRWDEGKESGIAGPLNMKGIIADERRKHAERAPKRDL